MDYRAQFHSGPSCQDSLKRMVMKTIRKVKGVKSKIRGHLTIGTIATSITVSDIQKSLNLHAK
jgi:hypothetical protein